MTGDEAKKVQAFRIWESMLDPPRVELELNDPVMSMEEFTKQLESRFHDLDAQAGDCSVCLLVNLSVFLRLASANFQVSPTEFPSQWAGQISRRPWFSTDLLFDHSFAQKVQAI